MDGPITASQLKDKSLFQDNNGSAVPARNVCHNCSKLKVWKGAFIIYFPWKPENDNMKFYQNSVSFVRQLDTVSFVIPVPEDSITVFSG